MKFLHLDSDFQILFALQIDSLVHCIKLPPGRLCVSGPMRSAAGQAARQEIQRILPTVVEELLVEKERGEQ